MASRANLRLPGDDAPSPYLTKLANSPTWQAFCPGSGDLTSFMRSVMARINPAVNPPSRLRSAHIELRNGYEPKIYQRASGTKFLYRGLGGWDVMDNCRIAEKKVHHTYTEHNGSSSVHMLDAEVVHPTSAARSPMAFIAKSWPHIPGQWTGLHTELGILQSERYLLPLQGKVVPYVIGVYAIPGQATIAMAPPHSSFWMEAHPTMPNVLKECVIEAYEQIHAHGVVHNNAALHHILIGADARVTIVDFSKAKGDISDPRHDVRVAFPNDKQAEMRRVKFLIDYQGAREIEITRSSKEAERKRLVDRYHAKEQEPAGLLRLFWRSPSRPTVLSQEPDKDAIPLDELRNVWLAHADRLPKRFVHPSMNDVELGLGVISFCERVKELVVGSSIPQIRPSSTIGVRTTPDMLWHRLLEDAPVHRAEETAGLPRSGSTRPGHQRNGAINPSQASSLSHRPSPSQGASQFQNRPPSHPSTSRRPQGTRDPPADVEYTDPPPLPAGSGIKSRDFAYERQPSSAGYRVPDPIMDDSAARNLAIFEQQYGPLNSQAGQAPGPSSSRMPGPSTLAPGPSANPSGPSTRAAGPSTRAAGPSAQVAGPSTQVAGPSTRAAGGPAPPTTNLPSQTTNPGGPRASRSFIGAYRDSEGRRTDVGGNPLTEEHAMLIDEVVTCLRELYGMSPEPGIIPPAEYDAMQATRQAAQTAGQPTRTAGQPTGTAGEQARSRRRSGPREDQQASTSRMRTRSQSAREAAHPGPAPTSSPEQLNSAQKRPREGGSGDDSQVGRKRARFSSTIEVIGRQDAPQEPVAGPSTLSANAALPQSISREPRSIGGSAQNVGRGGRDGVQQQAQGSSSSSSSSATPSQSRRAGKRRRDSSPSDETPNRAGDEDDDTPSRKRHHRS
ncbi:hypothetical protein DENSPDRAFT_834040 [Dentipellis sp. KUC8613]|nr:hypothetical protein DENSPDRAFT_834040 [Dentipellis sp. KUC8613]